MNRRDFLKTIPLAAALTSTLAVKAHDNLPNDPKHTYYDYYVNCYIQNQQYWPLEIYKDVVTIPRGRKPRIQIPRLWLYSCWVFSTSKL